MRQKPFPQSISGIWVPGVNSLVQEQVLLVGYKIAVEGFGVIRDHM